MAASVGLMRLWRTRNWRCRWKRPCRLSYIYCFLYARVVSYDPRNEQTSGLRGAHSLNDHPRPNAWGKRGLVQSETRILCLLGGSVRSLGMCLQVQFPIQPEVGHKNRGFIPCASFGRNSPQPRHDCFWSDVQTLPKRSHTVRQTYSTSNWVSRSSRDVCQAADHIWTAEDLPVSVGSHAIPTPHHCHRHALQVPSWPETLGQLKSDLFKLKLGIVLGAPGSHDCNGRRSVDRVMVVGQWWYLSPPSPHGFTSPSRLLWS